MQGLITAKNQIMFKIFMIVKCIMYCIRGNFRSGYIFTNFASQSSQEFPLQYVAIYHENITKISPHEFPHLVQIRENICTRNIRRILNQWQQCP